MWKRSGRRISIHTGVEFNVDPEAGLNGVCDFLLGRTAQLDYLEAPILAVVETKKDGILDGLGQCAAEMVAVQRFNLNAGRPTNPVYGLITTARTGSLSSSMARTFFWIKTVRTRRCRPDSGFCSALSAILLFLPL